MGIMRCPQLHRQRKPGIDTSEGSVGSSGTLTEEVPPEEPASATPAALLEDRLALQHIFRPSTPRRRKAAQRSTQQGHSNSSPSPITGSNLTRQKSSRLRIALLSEKIRRSFSREFQPSKASSCETEALREENIVTPSRSTPSTDILGSGTVSDAGYDSDARFIQTPQISQRVGDIPLTSRTNIAALAVGRDKTQGLKENLVAPSHDQTAAEARNVAPSHCDVLGRSPRGNRSPVSPLQRRIVRPTIPESILSGSSVNSGCQPSEAGALYATENSNRFPSGYEQEKFPNAAIQTPQPALSTFIRHSSSARCLKNDLEVPVVQRSHSCEPAFADDNLPGSNTLPYMASSGANPTEDAEANSTDLPDGFPPHGRPNFWMPARLASRLRLSTILSEGRDENGKDTSFSERSPSIYSGNRSSMGSMTGLKLVCTRRNNSSVDESQLAQQFPLPPSFARQPDLQGHNDTSINEGDSVPDKNSSEEQKSPGTAANAHGSEDERGDPSLHLGLRRSNSSIIQSRFIENLSDTRLSTIPASNPQSPEAVRAENDRAVSDGWLTEGKRRGYGYSFVSDDEGDTAASRREATKSPEDRPPLISGHPTHKVIVWKRRKAETSALGGRSISCRETRPLGGIGGACRPSHDDEFGASDSDSVQPHVLVSKKADAIRNQKSFSVWAGFPSHTRQERNASAGVTDHVISRDFDSESSPSSPRDKDMTSLAPSESRRSESTSSYVERGKHLFLTWVRSHRSNSADKRRYWANHKAAVDKDSEVEHSRLATIAGSPVAHRGKLESEDKSTNCQSPSRPYEPTEMQSENTPLHGPTLSTTYDGTAAEDNEAASSGTVGGSIGPQSAEGWSHLYEDCVERLDSREVSNSSGVTKSITMSPTTTTQEYPDDRRLLEPSTTSTDLRDSTVEYREHQFSNETRTRDSLLRMVRDLWGTSDEGVRVSA